MEVLTRQVEIYEVINRDGQVIYVGRANRARVRVNHFFNKHTKEAFGYRVIAKLPLHFACEVERRLIRSLSPKYNKSVVSSLGRYGRPMPDKTKEALRNSVKGRKLTEAHKRKLSEAHLGMVYSEEARRNMGLSKLGSKRSEETKARMSIAAKGNTNGRGSLGRKLSEDHKEKLRKAWIIRKARKEEKRHGS